MTFRLPRISASEAQAIAGANGMRLKLFLDRQADKIETQVTDILTAQNTATAAARESARIASYTVPTNVLTGVDTGGGTAKIVIANHKRVYPVQGTVDVADVNLVGVADITGLANSTSYSVYYDDPTLTLTSPTMFATTDPKTAQVGAAAGRHFVGVVTTPAGGGGSTGGTGGSPPGGNGGNPIP